VRPVQLTVAISKVWNFWNPLLKNKKANRSLPVKARDMMMAMQLIQGPNNYASAKCVYS
jgi:hypothetical protein